HPDAARARLPVRLRDGARAAAAAADSPHAGRTAVLDLVPHPDLRLDQHLATRRAVQSGAPPARRRGRARRLAFDQHRRLYRDRLFVFSLHGAAALRGAREDRCVAARGRRRSRRAADHSVLEGHGAAVAARHYRRIAALLHSDRRRVRDSRPARRLRDADDRADAVDRVLRQSRLADRVCSGSSAALPAARAGPRLSAPAGARDRGPVSMRKGPWVSPLGCLAFALVSLSLPIAILVIYSFNASRLVTVWGGWSLAWYRELLADAAMLESMWVSLRVALLSAAAATSLGTLAAVALARGGVFRGRLAFTGLVYAPLVMPEVITGLALLLLFVAIALDRGFWTITIAHTSVTLCFVAIVVESRLMELDLRLPAPAI